MCAGKIFDMNVVANAGAIGSRIIRPKHTDVWQRAGSDLQYQWD